MKILKNVPIYKEYNDIETDIKLKWYEARDGNTSKTVDFGDVKQGGMFPCYVQAKNVYTVLKKALYSGISDSDSPRQNLTHELCSIDATKTSDFPTERNVKGNHAKNGP